MVLRRNIEEENNMDEEISKKELFKKLVILETQLVEMRKDNKRTTRSFTLYAWWILVLTLINIFVHVLLAVSGRI